MENSKIKIRDEIIQELQAFYAELVADDKKAGEARSFETVSYIQNSRYFVRNIIESVQEFSVDQNISFEDYVFLLLERIEYAKKQRRTEPDTIKIVNGLIESKIPQDIFNRYHQIKSNRNTVTVFISYSSSDRSIVELFGKYLEHQGVVIWYDQKEIRVGDSIHSEITKGIDKSQFFCIFLSKNSIKSKWVQDELRQAISLYHIGHTRVLPIILDDCAIPGFLRGIHYLSINHKNIQTSIQLAAEKVLQVVDEYKQS